MHPIMPIEFSAMMCPQVLDAESQEFMGKVYQKKSTGYFICGARRLQRIVWSANYGELGTNHAHHDDRNKANNHPFNLQGITPSEHGKEHAAETIAKLSVWQKSDAGQKKLKEIGHKTVGQLVPAQRASTLTFNCKECGSETTKLKRGQNKFCSHACQQLDWLRRKTDHEPRTCANCGAEYTQRRAIPSKFCSRGCYYEAQRKGEVKCRST